MPDVIITAAAEPVTTPSGRPKARLVAVDTGESLELPWAPTSTQLDGIAAGWSTLDRAGRKPLTVMTDEGLLAQSFSLLLGSLDRAQSIEPIIALLRKFAAKGLRLQFLYSGLEAGYWRLTSLSIGSQVRSPTTNAVTRATASITLTEDSPAKVIPGMLTPATPPATAPGGTGWRTYKWKKGDTLYYVAKKYLGSGDRWPEIAFANGVTSSKAIGVGRTIRIPPK